MNMESSARSSAGRAESSLALGNQALRLGNYGDAITHYIRALEETPALTKTIAGNLAMARRRYQQSNPSQGDEGVTSASTSLKLAVVVHAFHVDRLEEISRYLKNIEHPFDVYVTTPKQLLDEIRPTIDRLFLTRKLRLVENVADAAAPFMDTVRELEREGYDLVCKLHTQPNHEQYQDNWRTCLLDGVLGSKQLVSEIIGSFEMDSSISLVGPALAFVSARMTIRDAGDRLRSVVSLLPWVSREIDDWGYFAGTMFWAKVSMFRPLREKLITERLALTECQSGELPGNAHLYEMIFGLLPHIENHKIALTDYRAQGGVCSPYIRVLPSAVVPRRSLRDNLRIFSLISRGIWEKWSALQHYNLLEKRWYLIENPKIIAIDVDCLVDFLETKNEDQYLNSEHKREGVRITFGQEGIVLTGSREQRPELLYWPDTHAGETFNPQPVISEHICRPDEIKVSVVCISYNHEKYIREALDGFVAQQAGFRFEVIVGDDASTDSTADIIREYAVAYPEIFVPILREKNVGAINNLLSVLDKVRGQYVALNDGDDYWIDPLKLQLQADYLDEHPECSICFHPVKIKDELAPKHSAIFPDDLPGEVLGLEDVATRNFIQTNSVMYRWGFHDSIRNYYNPNAFPADHYIHTLQAKLGEIHFIPKVMAVYRRNAAGMFSSISNSTALLKKWGVSHIESFRSLDRYLDSQYTAIYLSKELYIHRTLIREYLLHDDVEGLYQLVASYRDVFSIAAKDFGVNIGDRPIQSPPDLRKSLEDQFTISVLVTSYNHAPYLNACIESILAQKGIFSLEIVIADDASTDSSRELLEQYAIRYPRIVRLLPKTSNVGMLKNMQRGFEACLGNFIAICEGDDYWLSERKLHKQLCMLIQNPDLSMCFSWLLLYFESEKKFIPHPGQGNIVKDKLTFDDLISEPLTANFSCCLYRTQTIRNIPAKYYAEDRAADWLFNILATDAGDVGFLKELLSVYRIHDKGQWSGLSAESRRRQIIQARAQIGSYFPHRPQERLRRAFGKTDIAEIGSKSEDLAFDIFAISVKYKALFMQGWLVDAKSRSSEEVDKYFAVVGDDNVVVFWQFMENGIRSDVDEALSPTEQGRYLWSGFSVVFSQALGLAGEYTICIGQSSDDMAPKWIPVRRMYVSPTGDIKLAPLET